jgi:hypothetical protein
VRFDSFDRQNVHVKLNSPVSGIAACIFPRPLIDCTLLFSRRWVFFSNVSPHFQWVHCNFAGMQIATSDSKSTMGFIRTGQRLMFAALSESMAFP